MVKRRGYRVELGEIEAGLATHVQAKEVAVVALPDKDAGVKIKAFLSLKDG
jgi:acyl-coenzyme A synthetase/AMP-(fatty) acid ligase